MNEVEQWKDAYDIAHDQASANGAAMNELADALEEVMSFADKACNGLIWRFSDQPCAKNAREVLARVRSNNAK